jgi:hypothetical protein
LLAGLIDGCCYLGSALSSFGLGAISDAGGWDSVFLVLLIALSAVAGLALLYLIVSHIWPRFAPSGEGETRETPAKEAAKKDDKTPNTPA